MPSDRSELLLSPQSRRQFVQSSLAALSGLWLGNSGRSLFADEFEPVTKQLSVLSDAPFNGEPNLQRLIELQQTPLEHFFVRSHGAVPKLDDGEFSLRVEGLVHQPRDFKLGELREKFPQHTVEATLTCAGNRRTEMSALRKISGVAWGAGAIGNAEWTGPALSDILKQAEIKAEAKHIWFEGADPITEKDGSTAPFGGSIPIEKAMALDGIIPGGLIACLMNGRPLLPEHGFPFRSLVPGFIGARSVKWLHRITVSDRTSPNHYLADAYKVIQNDSAEDRAAAAPIYEFPVNGAICVPKFGKTLRAGRISIAGYALPTGRPDCLVEEVNVSGDGGQTWKRARLLGVARPYCWRLWTTSLPVTGSTRELIVRVRDSLGNEQPQVAPWNLKGYLFNSWHHSAVSIEG